MSAELLKRLLPNRAVPTRVWFGPFRGAYPVMNPRHSLRKVLGLYEHELNGWIEDALCRVNRVIDVGANDGYFTFGCAAAFRRLKKAGHIISIEAQDQHIVKLREGVDRHQDKTARFTLLQGYAGREAAPGFLTLDGIDTGGDRGHTLIKIDVEGAEVDVMEGALSWLEPTNLFVIEVHKASLLEPLHALFATRGLKLRQINQRPLPLLGAEERDVENWWLVSEPGDMAKPA